MDVARCRDVMKRNRRSIRLKEYNYSAPGFYFVTICTKDRECFFGKIINGIMELNRVGEIISRAWNQLPQRFSSIRTDEFVIMPNHMHGIISIVGAPLMAPDEMDIKIKGAINRARTLGEIIRAFKAFLAREIRCAGYEKFAWQRNYYERVIRNESELFRIRKYVQENPAKWHLDPENTDCEARHERHRIGHEING
jgi:REP element-mobilizing transposase RayT